MLRLCIPLWLALCLMGLGSVGCTQRDDQRQRVFGAQLSRSRVSDRFQVAVPVHSRSIAIVVRGEPDVLYALASFQVGGSELVDIPPEALADRLQAAYFEEGTAQPSRVPLQFARLGCFNFVYPYAPGQPLPAGPLQFRIAASRVSSDAQIAVLMPEEDGANVLHIQLVRVSEQASLDSSSAHALAQPAQAIFAQAGIVLQIDSVMRLRGTGLSSLPGLAEPWESPLGPLARLAQLGQAQHEGTGLPVYVVDDLPTGRDGVSLGLPGPPQPRGPYWGVVVRSAAPSVLGRSLAHEVAHFLGLRHVRTVTPSGQIMTDGIDDTEPNGTNLMEHGDRLTPGQIYTLLRSPLLQTR